MAHPTARSSGQPRVVIDTNVIVSRFFGGTPRAVVAWCLSGRATLCLTREVFEEYVGVLARFHGKRDEVSGFLSGLAADPAVLWVRPTQLFPGATIDPKDDIFLECAVAAGADYIISGDGHLQSLGSFRGIPILSPAQFLDVMCGHE